MKPSEKAGLALHGAKFVGFPNAPSFVSSPAELFLFVAASLVAALALLNTLCALACKKHGVIVRFASLQRQWLTQVLLAYAVVFIKPGSFMYKFAMPVGGVLAHLMMFDRERRLCTGGVLLVAAVWVVYGLISGFAAPKEFYSWWTGPTLF
jgi:hypothetical protein